MVVSAGKRENEEATLAALDALEVLDTGPEAVFDALVQAAASICGTSISLLSLIDSERQWFKANVGLPDVTETHRDIAFCAHAVLADDLFEVADASGDPRFADNPLVSEAPGIRFYAGMPIRLSSGHRVGTLCVIDRLPRALTEPQRETLRCLGRAAAEALEWRRATRALHASHAALEAERRRLATVEDFLDRAGRLAGVGGWQLELETQRLFWSDETSRIHGLPPGHPPALAEALAFYAPEGRPAIAAAVERCIEDGIPWDLELPLIRADGRRIWVRAVGDRVTDEPRRLVGAFQDITEQVRQRKALSDASDRISIATDSGAIGIWDFDLRTRATNWDPWMYRLYGLEPGGPAVTYATWSGSLPPHSLTAIQQAVAAAVAGGAPFDLEFEITWPDGSAHYLRSAARVVLDSSGVPSHLVGANWDVTKRKLELAELEAARTKAEHHASELRDLSVTDELTGLLNRRGFALVAEPDLKLATRNRERRAVIFIDLNGMKTINDTLGHTTGDLALTGTAQVLRRVFRDSDVLARLGGDEFAVLVRGAYTDSIDTIRARLNDAIEAYNTGAHDFRLSLSVGTAVFDGAHPTSLDEVLAQADALMYEAKRARLPSMRIKIR